MTLIPKGARFITEYTLGGSNFSESDKDHRIVCAAGKRLYIVGVAIDPDQATTIQGRIKDSNDVIYGSVMSEASTSSIKFWPAVDSSHVRILDAGEYLQIDLGTSQTGAAYIIIKYYEVGL